MTKHDTETTKTAGATETSSIPPIPDAILAWKKPLPNDPTVARKPFINGIHLAMTTGTDVAPDGRSIGNIWRPIAFDDTRNLPYEHPTRSEWDNERYDQQFLNFNFELLPTGWLPRQYKRFRTWEFGVFIANFIQDNIIDITWKGFHGIYAPKFFLFGCNAGWLEPNPGIYERFSKYATGSENPISFQDVKDKVDARIQRAKAVAAGEEGYEEELKSISKMKSYEIIAYANPACCRVDGYPWFHWKYPSYEKLLSIRPPGDALFPRLDLCDEQYEWEQSIYDQPDLDFSAEPTLPGYTRLQFLRRRAWERSCYEHRVAKLTGKRTKPLEPALSQSVIEKLQSNN